ncbi:MAG: membrane protein insertion efficiency factor YidD [Pseudobdellovibrionaceae bacterium]
MNIASRAAIAVIKVYRFVLSPFMGNQCRFTPTCSAYGEEAFRVHGFWKGFYLTFRRISRCHPWHKGKFEDNVPKRFDWGETIRYKGNNPDTKTKETKTL